MRILVLMLLMIGVAHADPLDWQPHPGAQVPLDIPLGDETGAAVTLRTVMQGRPAVLALGYHRCPNLCGVVRQDLFRAWQGGNRASLVSLSIDPRETAADAVAARRASNAPAEAHFLTGAARGVADAVGFPSRRDNRLDQFLHPAGLVVLTPSGRISSYLLGVGYTTADLQAAVSRAAADDVAPAPSPILLLCFHYDPLTGRYSLAIERVVQLAAAATAISLGLWLARAHRSRA